MDTNNFLENESWWYKDFSFLSEIMKYSRENCPYDNGMFKILYTYNISINTPCLIIMSYYIHSISHLYSKIVFSVRDTCYLYLIYKKLFPKDNSGLLFSNRNMYFNPTKEFDNYIKKTIPTETLVIDMHGTGKSFNHYFNKHINRNDVTILFISKLLNFDDILEFINYVRFGTLLSIDQTNLMPYFDELDYPKYLAYPIEHNIKNVLNYIDKNNESKNKSDGMYNRCISQSASIDERVQCGKMILNKLKQYIEFNKNNSIIKKMYEKYHNDSHRSLIPFSHNTVFNNDFQEFKDIFEKNKYPNQKSIKDIQIYIMHIPKYTERKEHIINLLKKLGLSKYEFITPFPPDKNVLESLSKFLNCDINKIHNSLTRASHSLTYYTILNKQDEEFILLEDDIEMLNSIEDTKIVLEFIINYHPKDTDMIFLEYCFENCSKNTQVYKRLISPLCLAAVYYPYKKGRQNILDGIKSFCKTHKHDATDWGFNYIIKNGIINAYEQQLLFYQDKKFGSHIDGSNKSHSPYCNQENMELSKTLIPSENNIIFTHNYDKQKKILKYFIIFITFLIFILLIYKKKYKVLIIYTCLLLVIIFIMITKNLVKKSYKYNYWKNLAKDLYDSENLNYISPYKLYSGWDGYRLGDMVKMSKMRNHTIYLDNEEYHHTNFPDSIASKYMKQTTDENNLNILFNIVKNHKGPTPPHDCLVVHLRIGDAIKPKESVIDILSKNHPYIKSLQHFDNIIKQASNITIKNIILVFASHNKNIDLKKSSLYINCVKKFLENNGYNVSLRLGNNPDDDFIFMSSSKYFSPAGGGYSNLITKMVEMNNNIII